MACVAFFILQKHVNFGFNEHLGKLASIVEHCHVQCCITHLVCKEGPYFASVDQESRSLEQVLPHSQMQRSVSHLCVTFQIANHLIVGKYAPKSDQEGRYLLDLVVVED